MSSSPEGHEVVVGRIGKAHGIKGEVSVEPRSDEPERRFADGAVLGTRTPRGTEPHSTHRPTTLTVRRTRWHLSRLLVTFVGVEDRTAAEALRGSLVEIDRADLPPLGEGEYYHADLVGLPCVDREGRALGSVVAVENFGAGDLLEVEDESGRRSLIPFKPGIADLAEDRIILDPEFLA